MNYRILVDSLLKYWRVMPLKVNLINYSIETIFKGDEESLSIIFFIFKLKQMSIIIDPIVFKFQIIDSQIHRTLNKNH